MGWDNGAVGGVGLVQSDLVCGQTFVENTFSQQRNTFELGALNPQSRCQRCI